MASVRGTWDQASSIYFTVPSVVTESNNLLVSLYKWASRQDENFLTEAFVHLLRHLLDTEPIAAATILNKLTNGVLNLLPQQAATVNVATQVSTSQGRPDIEIRTVDCLVYVEVKVLAELGHLQLKRYRELLCTSDFERTTLVLLTRRLPDIPTDEQPDLAIQWHQIAVWLEQELLEWNTQQESSFFLVNQFLNFLKARGMTVERVGWELVPGVESMRNLLALMESALEAERIPHKRGTGWYWLGYSLEDGVDFFFIWLEQPAMLGFRTYKRKLDLQRCEALGLTRVWSEKPVGLRWGNVLDFESEDVHFFARSKASQLQVIERFLRESRRIAEQITVQPEGTA